MEANLFAKEEKCTFQQHDFVGEVIYNIKKIILTMEIIRQYLAITLQLAFMQC